MSYQLSSSLNMGQQYSLKESTLNSMKKTDNSLLAQAFASGMKGKGEDQEVQQTIEKLNKKCYTLREVAEGQATTIEDLKKQVQHLKNQSLNLDSRVQGLTLELKKILQLELDSKFPELNQKYEDLECNLKEQQDSLTLCNEACHDYILFKNECQTALLKQSKR